MIVNSYVKPWTLKTPEQLRRARLKDIPTDDVRFYQYGKNTGWDYGPAIPDDQVFEATAGRRGYGYTLATPWRSTAALTEDQKDRLYLLGSMSKRIREKQYGKKRSVELEAEEKALLGLCPFGGDLPPIDIDVNKKRLDDDTQVLLGTPEQALAGATLFRTKWSETYSVDLPLQKTANAKGGYHLKLASPSFYHTKLLLSLEAKILKVCRACGLKDSRSATDQDAICVDLAMHHHWADGRARLYALENAPTFKTVQEVLNRNLSKPAERAAILALPRKLAATPVVQDFSSFVTDYEFDEAVAAKTAFRKKQITNPKDRLAGVSARQKRALSQISGQPLALLAERAGTLAGTCRGSSERHTFRLALAGWLLLTGMTIETVEATVAAMGGGGDTNVARTTSARISEGKPIKDYEWIQKRFKESGAKRLLEALGQDIATQTQSGLLAAGGDLEQDPITLPELQLGVLETSFGDPYKASLFNLAELAEYKGRRAAKQLFGAVYCGTVSRRWVCPTHGEICRCKLRCQHELTCQHCRSARYKIYANWISAEYPSQTAVAVIDLPSDQTNPVTQSLDLKARLRKELPKSVAQRYYHGHRKLMITCLPEEQKYLGYAVKKAREWGNAAEEVQIMTRQQVAQTFLDTRVTISKDFEALVEWSPYRIDPELVFEYPWMKKNLKLTSANKLGRKSFPWPSRDQISALAKGDKQEQPEFCQKVTELDEKSGIMTLCGIRIWNAYYHDPSEQLITRSRMLPTPYWPVVQAARRHTCQAVRDALPKPVILSETLQAAQNGSLRL